MATAPIPKRVRSYVSLGGDLGWGESPTPAFQTPPQATAGASPPAQPPEPGGWEGRQLSSSSAGDKLSFFFLIFPFLQEDFGNGFNCCLSGLRTK